MVGPAIPASARRDRLLVGGVAVFVGAMALFGGGYFVYLLNLIGIFALVAIGLNILIGFSGQTSLGHAGFFAIGAYASGILTSRLGLPFWLSILIAGAIATVIGAAIALPALRLKNLYLAIATLGFGIVTQKLIFEWRTVTGGGADTAIHPFNGNKGTSNNATILIILIKGLTAGPAVSLYGSPTVSPVTAALCASEPLPPK